MSEPILNIIVTPKGVQRVDAAVSTKQERKAAFALAQRVMNAIERLDSAAREAVAA